MTILRVCPVLPSSIYDHDNLFWMSIIHCSGCHKKLIVLYYNNMTVTSLQIAKFMGPTRGPPGSCRPQMDPVLAPWTLLSGSICKLLLFFFFFDLHWHVAATPLLYIERCLSSNSSLFCTYHFTLYYFVSVLRGQLLHYNMPIRNSSWSEISFVGNIHFILKLYIGHGNTLCFITVSFILIWTTVYIFRAQHTVHI